MNSALVNKIIPFSAVDGPGNRTAIFLQGCNFSCKYCHNPETMHVCFNCGECIKYCPTGAISLVDGKVVYDYKKCCFCDSCFKHCPNNSSPRVRNMTAEEVMVEVKKNVPFIRGITVSGGECTRWPKFLNELMNYIPVNHLLLNHYLYFPYFIFFLWSKTLSSQIQRCIVERLWNHGFNQKIRH